MINIDDDEIDLYVNLINRDRSAKYVTPVEKSEENTKYYCISDLLSKWKPFESVQINHEISLN
jgi:hypothetical protein